MSCLEHRRASCGLKSGNRGFVDEERKVALEAAVRDAARKTPQYHEVLGNGPPNHREILSSFLLV